MAKKDSVLRLSKDIVVPLRQTFAITFSDGRTEDSMGIDAIILATTAKRATAAEIVEWGRRLRSACPWSLHDYEAVPTETRPNVDDDEEEAGEMPHTGMGDLAIGGLVIAEKHWYADPNTYGETTFEPATGMPPMPTGPERHFGYEICTLNRSAWFDDGDGARLWCTSRGDATDIVKTATALALLMDPHVDIGQGEAPLGYEVRKDWRVWLGNDSSEHMFEFTHATRVELFEAYLRSRLIGETYWGGQTYVDAGPPCPVCGTKWRYSSDVRAGRTRSKDDTAPKENSKCPACAHGFATGKKIDTRHDEIKPTFPSKERFALMTTSEREILIRGLGEALQEAGVGDHVDINGLLAYTERSKGGAGG